MRTFFLRVKLWVLRTQVVDVRTGLPLTEHRSHYLCRLLSVLHVVMEVRTNRMML